MTTDYLRHVQAAERLLDEAQVDDAEYGIVRSELLAEAQVHATLALAAATRANGVITVREDRP